MDFLGWLRDITGIGKKKEEKKPVQAAPVVKQQQKPVFTAPTATEPTKPALQFGQAKPTPEPVVTNAASTNKLVIGKQNAPTIAEMVNKNRSDIYNTTYQKYIAKGRSEQDARKIADGAVEMRHIQNQTDAAQKHAEDVEKIGKIIYSKPAQLIRNPSEGIVRSITTLPGTMVEGVGTVGKIIAPDSSPLDKTFEDIRKSGQEMNDSAERQIMSKMTSPNDNKLAHDVLTGAGQLTGDIATTVATGGTGAVAKVSKVPKLISPAVKGTGIVSARYGVQEANQQFDNAKAAGMNDAEAGIVAAGAGVTQAALEKVGLDKFMGPTAGNVAKRMLTRAAVEGSQEGAQQLASNAYEATYNPNKDIMENVGYSALVGGLVGAGVGPVADVPTVDTQQTTKRDPSLPVTTSVVPKNSVEVKQAVENGIVTPLTASLSVDEQVQTALNSDIGERARARASDSTLTQNAELKAPTSDAITGDISPELQLAANQAAGPTYQWNSSNVPSSAAKAELVARGFGSVTTPDGAVIPLSAPDETIQYRGGVTGDPVSRSDMQAVQLENNRVFGSDSPNVQFTDGVMLTPDGRVALGSTTDIFNGPSKITLAKQQGDPQATYLHEAVHKALNDYMTSTERTQLLMSYASDKRVDAAMSEAQIEELVAEDFIQYVPSRKSNRFSAPPVVEQVLAVFEKVFKRLQLSLAKLRRVGKATPEYLKFYEDLYSGRYANETVIDKRVRDGVAAEELALEDHRNMLLQAYDTTPDGPGRKAISQQIAELNMQVTGVDSTLSSSLAYRRDAVRAKAVVDTFKQLLKAPKGRMARFGAVSEQTRQAVSKIAGVNISPTATIVIESSYARHFNKHTRDEVNPLTDADIANITEVINHPDRIMPGNFVRGAQRVKLTKRIDNTTTAIVEAIKKGNSLSVVTYFNESSRVTNAAEAPWSARPKRDGFTQQEIIPNTPRIVKDKKFRADPLPQSIIDEVIYDSNPDLYAYSMVPKDEGEPTLNEDGSSSIPRMHIDDLKHYLGNNYVDIPVRYRRKTGDRDIDLLAARAGYDDIGQYLEAISSVLERRRRDRVAASERAATMKQLREDPTIRAKALELHSKREHSAKRQTSVEYIAEHMPPTIREYYDEMLELNKNGQELHPERYAQLQYWLQKNSDRLLNAYRKTRPGIYNMKRSARIEKLAEFTATKKDAATLADLSPQAVKIEHINSRVDTLHLPGGDSVTKVAVKDAPGQKAVEFALAQSVDEKSGAPTFELIPMDNQKHTLKNGMVVDKNGRSVGTYVAVEPDGTQIAYLEGKPVNITRILGDIRDWGNINKATWDLDRLIEANAPDKATARRVQRFITNFKDQQEAMMKTELLEKRLKLRELEKNMMKHRPRGVSKKQLSQDLFLATEKKMSYQQLQEKYDQAFIDDYIKPTIEWWRITADSMLETTNAVLERNGFDPIPRLKNYITHIQMDPGFWEKVGIGVRDLNPLGSSISSDITPEKTRSGIPEEIVGLTENTSARRRWNPFAKQRRGSQFEADFFKAIDAYFEPMLFNKYMTPAASRARVVERAFRTFEKAQDMANESRVAELAEHFGLFEAKRMVQSDTKRTHKGFKAGINGPFVAAWQEYGNMLAGKTNKWDRAIIDSSDTAAKAVRLIGKLQSLVGTSTIPGSASAALAQTLSIPQTIARDSMASVAKAVGDMVTFEGARAGSKDPLRKSAFMRARYTDAQSKRVGLLRRYTTTASKPMTAIERTVGEFSWRSAYHEALKSMPQKEAIIAADIVAKKTLAGRGIGDRPLAMNSKALGVFTQFGLEVNNMRLQFFSDFTTAQKVKFMFAAFAMNAVFGMITGNEQLPDYIKAIMDSIDDFGDDEDDKKDTAGDNALQAFQRLFGETTKFVPGASSVAGVFMDDKTKETYFGKNGDMSRYGTPAISRILGIGTSLIKGDYGKAAGDSAALAPTGNQWRKTMTGAAALQNGYTETSDGRVRNVYDNEDPLTAARVALFGRNAIPGETDAMNRGDALTKKQAAVFKKLYEEDKQKAVDYFKKVMRAKMEASNRKGTLTDTGLGDAASASDGGMRAAMEKTGAVGTGVEHTWASGDVALSDIVTDENGKVDRSYYKEMVLADSSKQDEATYRNYLLAYGIESGTRYSTGTKPVRNTGNSDIDKMVQAKEETDKSDIASRAVAMFKKDEKYAELPDWVKERYYSEAGFSKKDVEYGALASFDSKTKLNNYYRPLAEKADHATLMAVLLAGRKQSIYKDGYIAAQDTIITSLQKEGYISKDEAKYLKSKKIDSSGKAFAAARSSSRSSARRNSRKVSDSDIDKYLKSTRDTSGAEIAAIVKKYSGAAFRTGSVKGRQPTVRKVKAKKTGKKSAQRII